jgi:hypothetical protein
MRAVLKARRAVHESHGCGPKRGQCQHETIDLITESKNNV